jgi:hypothetical protein
MDMDKVSKAIDEADAYVMRLCAPDRMTPEESVQFLERLICNLEGALEALNDE